MQALERLVLISPIYLASRDGGVRYSRHGTQEGVKVQRFTGLNVTIEKRAHVRLDPRHPSKKPMLLKAALPPLKYRLRRVMLAVLAKTGCDFEWLEVRFVAGRPKSRKLLYLATCGVAVRKLLYN